MTYLRIAKAFSCGQRLGLIAALLLSLGATTARAQDDDIVRVETNLVQLNVGVADRRGQAITTLRASDFVVYEDDVRQSIVSFQPTEAPFSMVLLLDLSGSTLSFRSTLRSAAIRFLDALAPEDRVAVIAFDSKPRTLVNFTTDRRRLAFAIQQASGQGQTELYQALRYSLEQLARENNRRRAIVVMTDGIDTAQRSADRILVANANTDEEALAAVRPGESPTLRAVLDAADRQGVTIYPLALPSGDPRRIPLPSPQQTAFYTAARARLQMLANRTGGRLHEINRLEDLGRLYGEVAADLRTLYSIAYQPSGERPRDGRWRTIRIEVATRPEVIARTREGYYAR